VRSAPLPRSAGGRGANRESRSRGGFHGAGHQLATRARELSSSNHRKGEPRAVGFCGGLSQDAGRPRLLARAASPPATCSLQPPASGSPPVCRVPYVRVPFAIPPLLAVLVAILHVGCGPLLIAQPATSGSASSRQPAAASSQQRRYVATRGR
jgi:hypothetical protein